MTPDLTLTVGYVSFSSIEFEAEFDGSRRPVVALVGSGSSWRRAIVFPHGSTSAGKSLGSAALDAEVRRRASEEIVRLGGAIEALHEAAA